MHLRRVLPCSLSCEHDSAAGCKTWPVLMLQPLASPCQKQSSWTPSSAFCWSWPGSLFRSVHIHIHHIHPFAACYAATSDTVTTTQLCLTFQ